ncbi:hypothetical protein LguiB_033196 [Lonicera macranthoides]
MVSNLFPKASYLFSVTIATIISTFIIVILPCFCQENDQYRTCGESFQCARIQNIGYPFWGGNQPGYCGHSAFELNNCQGDVPLITINSITYWVLSLNKRTRSLTVARADFWDNTCPTLLLNTSLDSTPFTSSSTNHIIALYYGCTTFRGQVAPLLKQFNCTVNGTGSVNYFMLNVGPDTSDMLSCNSSVRVPVNGTWGQALASTTGSTHDLELALASGFEVRWTANDTFCNQCQGSGGRCGSNTDSNLFSCYCADGVYDSICNTTAQNVPSSRLNLGLKLAIGKPETD